MNLKDSITGVFMFLTIASWIAIASILTDIRDVGQQTAYATSCTAWPRDIGCDESVNIDTEQPSITGDDVLSVY